MPNSGSGWNTVEWFAVLDVNGDAKADLVAVRTGENTLWRWPGGGSGSLATGVQVGSGWSGYRPAHH